MSGPIIQAGSPGTPTGPLSSAATQAPLGSHKMGIRALHTREDGFQQKTDDNKCWREAGAACTANENGKEPAAPEGDPLSASDPAIPLQGEEQGDVRPPEKQACLSTLASQQSRNSASVSSW